ncbi:MAG: AI-2E family transporter, partial [SAR324 cluster bacterium]|nr:AI-2E family transporter [SAR324 cluster bacterium]
LMAITNSFITALLALGWILVIHFIEGNILNPKIMGKSAEIHPVLVILALMAGQNAYGIFGALIAVPLFSILQNTFLFIRELIFNIEEVSGSETAKVPKYDDLDE